MPKYAGNITQMHVHRLLDAFRQCFSANSVPAKEVTMVSVLLIGDR